MGLFDMINKLFKQNIPQDEISVTVSISTQKTSLADMDGEVIPVDIRMKTAIASMQGLFPHEILVLDYAHTFYTSGNSFQRFWWYRYGVDDVQAILCSLVERGFLQIGDLRAALENHSSATIKEALKAHDIKTTGKKTDLIQRALDEIPESVLKDLFPKRTYILTDNGKDALNEGAYVSYIHRHGVEDLDIWSFNKLVHTQPLMPYRDKLWEYLNQRSMKHFSDRNFGLYRNCRFCMAQFLKEEKKISNALAMLAEVVFYDLSGVSNNYDPKFLDIYASGFFPYEKSLATTAPGIVATIVECQKELGYTDENIKSALIERMGKLSAPLQLFTIEECAQIVLLERDQNKEALKEIYAKAKRTFIQKYPNIKV